MLDNMDEINFWNPKFFVGLGFPILGTWYMLDCDLRGTPLEFMLSISPHIGLQ